MVLLCRATGEIRDVHCWRLGCGPCLARCAYVRALAITDAEPTRFATLTQVGDDWQTTRGRMKRFAYGCRQRGWRAEWVWMVEPNPAGTGHHVHLWERGDYLPQRGLSAAARAVGMGSVVDVRAWSQDPAEAATYGLKGTGYGLKGVAAADAGARYLACNGRRLTHQTRSFFSQFGVRHDERMALARRRTDRWHWEVVSRESIRWDSRALDLSFRPNSGR